MACKVRRKIHAYISSSRDSLRRLTVMGTALERKVNAPFMMAVAGKYRGTLMRDSWRLPRG